jgi:uncharacterized protein
VAVLMRVWIDLTNSPHVLVMRPVIERLRADGHDVRVTAREFAQTIELCERLQIEHTRVGHHRGERLSAKLGGLASRSSALIRWALADMRAAGERDTRGAGFVEAAGFGENAGGSGDGAGGFEESSRPPGNAGGPSRPGRFDIAMGHGSNDISVAAAALRIPSATMFDYEWAAVQHHVNCRLARAVVVPDAIPPERLRAYGAEGKLRPYPGLKEEYYLADFTPDPTVLAELALDLSLPLAIVRTPPEVSLYHRFANDLFAEVLIRARAAAKEQGAQIVVLPRTPEQRTQLSGVPGFVVPPYAIDAQSLIAYADLVVSAGGTMNREAVALGTPVYTTFEGRLGAVDERLIGEGRLRKLTSADQLTFAKRAPGAEGARVRRDPGVLVDLLLSPLTALESR